MQMSLQHMLDETSAPPPHLAQSSTCISQCSHRALWHGIFSQTLLDSVHNDRFIAHKIVSKMYVLIFAKCLPPLDCTMWLSTHLTIRWEANRVTATYLRRDRRNDFWRRSMYKFTSTFAIKPQSFFDVIPWNQRLTFRTSYAGKWNIKYDQVNKKIVDAMNFIMRSMQEQKDTNWKSTIDQREQWNANFQA